MNIGDLDTVSVKIQQQFTAAVYSGKQVIKYSTRILFNFGWMNPIGSVFSWWMLARTIVMCLVTVFAAEYRCEKASKPWEFCFPILSSSEGLLFASLVSFLLGLFTTNTFGRWWTVREKLSAIMNQSTLITMWVTSYVKADGDEVVQNNRRKLIRLLNLGHATLYKQANGDHKLHDLLDSGLIQQEEAQVLQTAPNKCAIITAWQLHTLETFATKIAPAAVFANINTAINAVFTAQQDIFTLLDTQLPYAYLHLLSAIVKIHLIFVTFYAAGIVAQGIDGKLWTRILLGFATIIFNNIIYEGLLYIHDMLVNPLGHDRGDFPHHLYRSSTESLTRFIQLQPAPHTQREQPHEIESPELHRGNNSEIAVSSDSLLVSASSSGNK